MFKMIFKKYIIIYNSERFEHSWVNVVVWVIVWVCSVVLRRTVARVDWRFENLMMASAQINT